MGIVVPTPAAVLDRHHAVHLAGLQTDQLASPIAAAVNAACDDLRPALWIHFFIDLVATQIDSWIRRNKSKKKIVVHRVCASALRSRPRQAESPAGRHES